MRPPRQAICRPNRRRESCEVPSCEKKLISPFASAGERVPGLLNYTERQIFFFRLYFFCVDFQIKPLSSFSEEKQKKRSIRRSSVGAVKKHLDLFST